MSLVVNAFTIGKRFTNGDTVNYSDQALCGKPLTGSDAVNHKKRPHFCDLSSPKNFIRTLTGYSRFLYVSVELLSITLNPPPHVLRIQLIEFLKPQRHNPQYVLLLFFRQLAIELQEALFIRLKSVFLTNVFSK
ncbi:hypothetical protein SB5439_01117 [Klebsiella variicola]|nr:hypothetical protein SB5439_01117 [Klebsiella variicola]